MAKQGPGRPRNRENSWMPPWVYLRNSGYAYHNRGSGEYRKLCGPNASKAEVWAAYDALAIDPAVTVEAMIDGYFCSPQFCRLKPETQKGYQRDKRRLLVAFGAMLPDQVTSIDVQTYVDKCGSVRPTATNHERALLSIIFNWGKARGYTSIHNPVQAVKPVPTKPGGHYVEDADYLAFYNLLIERKHFMHAAAMEIAYLCGSRQQDVLRLLRCKPTRYAEEDCYVVDEGLVIWQAKTGKVQLKAWNDDLRAAVELALSHHKTDWKLSKGSQHVLRGRTGNAFDRGGFNSTWLRRQVEAEETGIVSQRFRFHDMKIKALSDFEGSDLVQFSGHKSRSQAERYNRTPDKVTVLRRPKG